jgi:hypothetical protein
VLSWRTISGKIGMEKKQKNISKKGSKDKPDNVAQRLEVLVEDTSFIDGKTQYGKLWMKEQTNDLNDELTFRGLEEFLLLGWKEKIKAVKNHEHEKEPGGGIKFFFAQLGAPFVISKL